MRGKKLKMDKRVKQSCIERVLCMVLHGFTLSFFPEFPRWFLKKFEKGFPPDWKALYNKMLTESRE